MRIFVTVILFLFTCSVVQAQLSKDQRDKISQQLQKESVDLENKVCADPVYKSDCDHLKDGKLTPEQRETEGNAFEDKIYADPKYSKAYKHIQLLHEQLGVKHHGKSQ